MTSVFIEERGEDSDSDTQREDGHLKTEAEVWVKLPETK